MCPGHLPARLSDRAALHERPREPELAGVLDSSNYLGFVGSRTGQHQSMVLHLIGLIVLGLLVGALGRLFHPGRDRMGVVMTMVIGVASVVLAGLIIGGLLGFILAVIIGVLLVALWSHIESRRAAPKWKRTLHVD
jgi:uncharacterized membrane protein YeaQ/YmgE (transglycosylase-associated protein family)